MTRERYADAVEVLKHLNLDTLERGQTWEAKILSTAAWLIQKKVDA